MQRWRGWFECSASRFQTIQRYNQVALTLWIVSSRIWRAGWFVTSRNGSLSGCSDYWRGVWEAICSTISFNGAKKWTLIEYVVSEFFVIFVLSLKQSNVMKQKQLIYSAALALVLTACGGNSKNNGCDDGKSFLRFCHERHLLVGGLRKPEHRMNERIRKQVMQFSRRVVQIIG